MSRHVIRHVIGCYQIPGAVSAVVMRSLTGRLCDPWLYVLAQHATSSSNNHENHMIYLKRRNETCLSVTVRYLRPITCRLTRGGKDQLTGGYTYKYTPESQTSLSVLSTTNSINYN